MYSKNGKRYARSANSCIAKTIKSAAQLQMQSNPQMFAVAGLRGAYAMQTGNTVNAKNITVYAIFNCAIKAASFIKENKMGLYAQVIAQ